MSRQTASGDRRLRLGGRAALSLVAAFVCAAVVAACSDLFRPSVSGQPNPVAVVGGLRFTSLTAGGGFTCGLTSGGAAYCWGYKRSGELGDGSTDSATGYSRSAPVAVGGGFTFASLTAGDHHACGLTSGGVAYCWGSNESGQLGTAATIGQCYLMADLPPIACSAVPVAVAGGLTFASLAAGAEYTCGLTSSGAAYCWGGGDSLRAAPGGLTFVELACGYRHTCGLTSDGAAYCWGYNVYGELGDGSTDSSTAYWHTTPVAVAGGLAFTRLTAGYWHTCGLTGGGKAYCWGGNSVGQLGDGSTTRRLAPVGVAGGLVFANLTAGSERSCGVTSGGAAYCWGSNDYSELGTTANFSSCLLNSSGDFSRCSVLPVAVTGGLTFASLTAGYSHTCGLTGGGAAYCWGNDLLGELGNGSTINLVAGAHP